MDYRFLAKTEVDKLFEESSLSVSEIIEVLYLTKIKLESKTVKTTDRMLYEAMETVFEDILSDESIVDDKEWETTVKKVFKIKEDEQK